MRTPFAQYIGKHHGSDIAEVFELNQMLLVQGERVHTGNDSCFVKQGSFRCTLIKGHKGQHIAHNLLGNIVGRWDF